MSTQRAAAKLQDDSAGAALTETPMTTSQSVGGLSFHAHHTVRPLVICQQKSVHKVDIRAALSQDSTAASPGMTEATFGCLD